MSILGIVVVLIVVGVLLYLVHTVIPMDQRIRVLIDVVVILAVVVWLLNAFGLFDALNRPIIIEHRRG